MPTARYVRLYADSERDASTRKKKARPCTFPAPVPYLPVGTRARKKRRLDDEMSPTFCLHASLETRGSAAVTGY